MSTTKRINWKYTGVMAVIFTAAYGVSQLPSGAETLPESYATAIQLRDFRNCKFDVEVKGYVLLSHTLEVHPNSNTFPDAYTAVDKDLYNILDTIPADYGESAESILGRVPSPFPDEFFIGKWLESELRPVKKYCEKPPPKKPKPAQKDSLQ